MVSGWYGHGNSGDEAILIVLLQQLARLNIHRTYVLTSRPDEVTRIHGHLGATGVRDFEMVGQLGLQNLLRGCLGPKLRLLRGAKVFILGGGSLLRDNTTWRNLWRLVDDVFLARLFGVPVFFYALGIGPFRSWAGKRIIALAARCAQTITVREEASAALLRRLGIKAERITVVTDPAFLLDDMQPDLAENLAGLKEFRSSHPRTLFVYPAVSITHPPLAPHDDRHVAALGAGLRRLCQEDGWAVVLVPMWRSGGDDDLAVSYRIQSAIGPGCAVHVVQAALEPAAIRALTALATLNIAIRLHAMIYAASLGMPSVALNYEPKVSANAEKFDLLDYLVGFGPGCGDQMVAAVRLLETRLPLETQRLQTISSGLRNSAVDTFTRLATLLDNQ